MNASKKSASSFETVLNNDSLCAEFSGLDTAGVTAPALGTAKAKKRLARKTFLLISISIVSGIRDFNRLRFLRIVAKASLDADVMRQ